MGKTPKCFYDNLMKAYGPRHVHIVPIRSKDGVTVYTNQSDILQRWAEHFNSLLNQQSSFDHTVLNEIPQWPVSESLAEPPSLNEVQWAIKQFSNGKVPGADSIPAEAYKLGGIQLILLFSLIWCEEEVPA